MECSVQKLCARTHRDLGTSYDQPQATAFWTAHKDFSRLRLAVERLLSPGLPRTLCWLDTEQRLVEANCVAVLNEDLNNSAGFLRLNLIEDLHGLDHANHGVRLDH